jgi:hypothetical protein
VFLRRSAAKTLTIDTDGAGGALTALVVPGALLRGFSGTSFPASPSVNDTFYRTDAAEWFFYSGPTFGWLCTNEHEISMPVSRGLNPYAATTDDYFTALPFAQAGALYVEVLIVNAWVVATNDATKYWTASLTREDGTVIGSVSTQGLAPNTDLYLTDNTLTNAVSATHKYLYLHLAKSSTPGNIYINATIGYRHTLT